MQGEVNPEDAARVAGELYDMGCYEVSMGDTIGVATPASTAKLFQASGSWYNETCSGQALDKQVFHHSGCARCRCQT